MRSLARLLPAWAGCDPMRQQQVKVMKRITSASLTFISSLVGITAMAQFSGGDFKLDAERHQARPRSFPSPSGPPQFGEPLRGLTTNQLAAFAVGLDNFQEEDTIE